MTTPSGGPQPEPTRPPERAPLLAGLLPDGISTAEAIGDGLKGPLPPLWPSEEGGLGPRAVHGRRVAYHWSRALARRAMAGLGHEAAGVPKGPSREPVWPARLVGSITHCDGYCAAAVAWRSEWRSVGIDAEAPRVVVPGVAARIATKEELSRLEAAGDPQRATVALFSAKEAVYKVWFPITGAWLGFHDAVVEFSGDAGGAAAVGSFTARILVPAPVVGGRELSLLEGRVAHYEDLVITAIAVPAD